MRYSKRKSGEYSAYYKVKHVPGKTDLQMSSEFLVIFHSLSDIRYPLPPCSHIIGDTSVKKKKNRQEEQPSSLYLKPILPIFSIPSVAFVDDCL